MTKWTSKFLSSAKPLQNSRSLKIFKPFLKHSYLWSRSKLCIARGVAAGLAGAVIPGFQIFYATILAILLRGNLPIALVSTFITNPFTVTPITYFIYYIGSLIVKNGSNQMLIKEFQWDFSSFHAFWSQVAAWTLQFGKGFLIGLPIVSLCLGIIGYFGTILIWKLISLFPKKKR